MPLVLSLKEGHDFYVAEEQFVLERINGPMSFTLRYTRTQQTFDITDAHATEIAEDVFVSAGKDPRPEMVRVAIDAPRELLIVRGDKKRNPPEHVQKKR